MNMIKEGIQTRRRKQKAAHGSVKPRMNKQSAKDARSEMPLVHPTYDQLSTREPCVERADDYPYGGFYAPAQQHSRYSSQQPSIINSTDFDAERCARDIARSFPTNGDQPPPL